MFESCRGTTGNKQADMLASRAPVVGILTIDKGDNVKVIYQRLFVKGTKKQVEQHIWGLELSMVPARRA